MTITYCFICGEPVDSDAAKHDDTRPVYTDGGAYHLGCESDVFDEVYAEV
jgi:hypothetical protein